MEVAIVAYFGCEVPAARKRIPLFIDGEFDMVEKALAAYRGDSHASLEERLVADGISVFGHGLLVSKLMLEFGLGDKIPLKTVCLGVAGCEIGMARQRIPLFSKEDYEAVESRLSSCQCSSQGNPLDLLRANHTNIYGAPALTARLAAGLA